MTSLLLTACGTEEATESESMTESGSETVVLQEDGVFSVFDQTTAAPAATDTVITLNGASTTVEGDGVTVVGQIVTIEVGGTYYLSGKLTDGQLRVNVPKTEKVRLYFDGVDIRNASTAPLWVQSADKVAITLAPGSDNLLTDAPSYTFVGAETKPNACLYSSEDLTINGTGALTVTGSYNNGIGTKNDLHIVSGTVTVTAKNNALKGNDSVAILGGVLNLSAQGDGIKADTEDDPSKGYVQIRGGEITIAAGDEGIQAFTSLSLEGGSVRINAAGDPTKCDGKVTVADGVLK